MANLFDGHDEATKWGAMVRAGKMAIEQNGYSMEKRPGRGLSNIWAIKKDGAEKIACIRTTRDRYIAFPPLEKATKWKTLDEVDLVVVATVDDKDDPQKVLVYLFPADDVRKRFDANVAARVAANQPPRDNFGMWVALDLDQRKLPISVGSGIVEKYQPIAEFSLQSLLNASLEGEAMDEPDTEEARSGPTTVAKVMADARERLASLLGVRPEAVKLDLRIEY